MGQRNVPGFKIELRVIMKLLLCNMQKIKGLERKKAFEKSTKNVSIIQKETKREEKKRKSVLPPKSPAVISEKWPLKTHNGHKKTTQQQKPTYS